MGIYKQKETKSAKAFRNQVRQEFIFVSFVIFCYKISDPAMTTLYSSELSVLDGP